MRGYPPPPPLPRCPLPLPTIRRPRIPSKTTRVLLPISFLSQSRSSNPFQARYVRYLISFLPLIPGIEALTVLIQFYASQDSIPHVSSLGDVRPKLLHKTRV